MVANIQRFHLLGPCQSPHPIRTVRSAFITASTFHVLCTGLPSLVINLQFSLLCISLIKISCLNCRLTISLSISFYSVETVTLTIAQSIS